MGYYKIRCCNQTFHGLLSWCLHAEMHGRRPSKRRSKRRSPAVTAPQSEGKL